MSKRVFVLGLDGFPYSFLCNKYVNNVMPYFSLLCNSYKAQKLKSVYPVVSSVAWTSFATGGNPGEHNIFGFTDRNCNPFNITIPTSKNRRKKPIWSSLKTQKKKIVINVPITYPPESINGYMVSCFLCTDINNASFPKEFASYLKENEYIIDVDAWLVRTDPLAFIRQLIKAMDKRFEIANKLLSEDWDYFQLHIMETDRLLHFFIDHVLKTSNDELHPLIDEFFRKLDKHIFLMVNSLISNSAIIVLSDHGFCPIKEEVQLNRWLENNNYLILSNSKQLQDYDRRTICYALTPGRIYLNLRGREERGSVSNDFVAVRNEIRDKLDNWYHPVSGEKIIDKIFFSEEIYSGEYRYQSPDIIVHPNNGYDLKSDVSYGGLFTKSDLRGMHTYDDAMIMGINIDISKIKNIDEVYYSIKDYIEDGIF